MDARRMALQIVSRLGKDIVDDMAEKETDDFRHNWGLILESVRTQRDTIKILEKEVADITLKAKDMQLELNRLYEEYGIN